MEYNWSQFLLEWKKPYHDVKNILRYLNTCPSLIAQLKINDLNTPAALDDHQKDWLSLLSQYEGMEKAFFKPWWVLVSSSSLDLFIDLSDPGYPLFESEYIFVEPYHYFRNFLFNNISDLLSINEANFDFEAFHEKRLRNSLGQADEFFREHKRLGDPS